MSEITIQSGAEGELHAVREDTVIGSVTVRRSIGIDMPRYWYHVGSVVHAATELRMFHQQRTLLMNNDYTGACELTGLRCDASLAAEVRLAALRELIRAALASLRGECVDVIVELPGVRDEHGGSPFWNGLGRRFYEGDPQQAESRFGEAWVSHVAALLPRSPLIVSFLPETAQKSIGEVAPEASEQLEALQLEGFRRSRYVAIDDAGPVLEISLQA